MEVGDDPPQHGWFPTHTPPIPNFNPADYEEFLLDAAEED